MLLLNFIKRNRYNYCGEECRTSSTMIVMRLRMNRLQKGDLRISLIPITTFSQRTNILNPSPFDVCEWYNIYIYII